MMGLEGFDGKTALVVDDVFLNRIVLGKTLQNFGFRVLYAENGLEAVQTIEKEMVDIVFMDLMMPIMDGFDAIITIRKSTDSRISLLPVIAISANCNQNEPERSLECGADVFVPKPFESKDLNSKISDLLSGKKKRNTTSG